jgi:fumarate reductase flavoprotein subunit
VSILNDNLSADLLIIGGGGSGLAAAVQASELGCKDIFVLEKRSSPGGTSRLSLGILAAESPVQKRAMIDCSRDYCFKTAMEFSHWQINPRIVRAFIEKSGDTVRWLEEKGLKFNCLPFYLKQAHPTWHVPEGNGAALVDALVQNCSNAGVKVMTGTSARRIILDSSGAVEGVIATAADKEFRISTGRVIICTGGSAGNNEILKKYYPHYFEDMKCMGLPQTGDGLALATEAGADVDCPGTLLAGADVPVAIPVSHGLEAQTQVRFMAFSMEPETLWVNKNGQRFIDEGSCSNHFESPNAILRQPGKEACILFDSGILRQMPVEKFVKDAIPRRQKIDVLIKAMHEADKHGQVKISSSWTEISGWIGADCSTLKTTVDEYNDFCRHGYDRIFAKATEYLLPLVEPPFFAVRAAVTFVDTVGGIKINEKMQVMDKSDNPIPGLFAAGVTTGGWESETYCAVLSGSAFGFAINSGRIAAENALKGLPEAAHQL